MTAGTRANDTTRHVAAPVTRNVVRRNQLFDLLDRAQEVPVLLICGPAGYGKSLLVGSWWNERAFEHGAWVNLAFTRASTSQTWAAIVGAVRTTMADSDPELEAIETLAFTAPRDVAARLARWITERDHETHLVLDELHTVADIGLHEQLVELVAAAASRLRLVAITRHDPLWPLHRMRLDGLLTDVRAVDLAFDDAEAAKLFSLLGVVVSPDRLHQLVETTQGWAAGLRLAALGATTATDAGQYLDSLSGRDQYIADYLLREVYEGLGPGWTDFLARIGVVEEISPELAEALGCGPDSGERLAELARQNAFTHQVGHRLGWYRLHPLLLDFLRSRATDEAQRRELHGRAARWFENQSEPRQAMAHALAAQDWDMAGDLVGSHVVSWAVCRPPTELKQLLGQVPREAILTRPGLAIGMAAALAMIGDPEDLAELVAAARAQLGEVSGVRRQRYEFLLELINLGKDRWTGDLRSVLAGCRRLPTEPAELGALELADWLAIRTLLISNTGSAELWIGCVHSAQQHLAEAARLVAGRADLPTLNAQAHLAYLLWSQGELTEADELGRTALDGLVRMDIPHAVQARSAYLAIAGVAVDRDELEVAARWLQIANESAGEPHTEFATDLMAARLQAARGQVFDAVLTIRSTRDRHAAAPLPVSLIAQSHLLEAELLLLAGNVAAARTALEAGGISTEASVSSEDTVRARIGVHLTVCRRATAANQQQTALDELESALVLAAPQLMRRPFLARASTVSGLLSVQIERGTREPDFAADLLGRLVESGPSRQSKANAVFVPLTARELNILRYLASTLTTREIADALYLSVNTVKTHQRSIHQKLGAGDRRHAVTRARSLGLL